LALDTDTYGIYGSEFEELESFFPFQGRTVKIEPVGIEPLERNQHRVSLWKL